MLRTSRESEGTGVISNKVTRANESKKANIVIEEESRPLKLAGPNLIQFILFFLGTIGSDMEQDEGTSVLGRQPGW